MAAPARVLESQVPEILLALDSLVKAQPEIAETAVILGSKYVNEYHDYLVYVGHRPNAEATVPATRVSPGGYQPNDIETVPVPILIAATNADDDMAAAVVRARDLQTVVLRAIQADLTLGLGKNVTASLGAMNWQLLHTDKGAEANVWFDLDVKAAL